jgi:hypothetical protein
LTVAVAGSHTAVGVLALSPAKVTLVVGSVPLMPMSTNASAMMGLPSQRTVPLKTVWSASYR